VIAGSEAIGELLQLCSSQGDLASGADQAVLKVRDLS
jgi:hypothetical protein